MVKRDDTIFDRAREELMVPLNRLQRLKALMQDWAKWMHKGGSSQGHASQSPGLCGSAKDFDARVDAADARDFCAINAALEDLEDAHPAQRFAIDRCYGIASVFRHERPSYPYELALRDGHDNLLLLLPGRGVEV